MTRKEQIQQLLATTPQDPFLRFALAKEYEKEGDDAEAIRGYEALAQDSPDYVGTYYHLGKALERVRREADAWRTYTTGMAVAKRLGEAHALTELGGARMELGDEEDFS